MKKETKDEYIDIRDFPGIILLLAFYIFSLIFIIINYDNWLDAVLIGIALGIPFSGIPICFWLLLTKKAEREQSDTDE